MRVRGCYKYTSNGVVSVRMNQDQAAKELLVDAVTTLCKILGIVYQTQYELLIGNSCGGKVNWTISCHHEFMNQKALLYDICVWPIAKVRLLLDTSVPLPTPWVLRGDAWLQTEKKKKT